VASTDVQILTQNDQVSPLDYTIPAAQEIVPRAIFAECDGSGAGGAFLPTLQIISPSGHVVASCPAEQVAAGASADVSWFPRVAAQAKASGSGIQFDTEPQSGDWLDVETTGTDAGGFGMHFTDSGGGIKIEAVDLMILEAGNWNVVANGNLSMQQTQVGSDITIYQSNGGGEIQIFGNGALRTDILIGIGPDGLGFYGIPPVQRQAHPVTLADVIAVLTNLGLTH